MLASWGLLGLPLSLVGADHFGAFSWTCRWLMSQGGHLDSVLIPANTESSRSLDLIKKELPLPSSFGLIFRNPSLRATDPAFQAEVERAVTPLRNDPRVANVRTAYDTAVVHSRSISRDGHSTIVKVELKDDSADDTALAMDIYPKLRAKVQSDTLEVVAFGALPRNHDFTVVPERDIRRAELVVLPLVVLLLVLVFGSVFAAALPLAVGVLAVAGGMACTLALAHITPVLVFATSIVVMVGLGVAIDYSLFIVSRFREEHTGILSPTRWPTPWRLPGERFCSREGRSRSGCSVCCSWGSGP